METLKSSPLVLSWKPEIEDYREAFHARDVANRLPAKSSALCVAMLVIAVYGFIAQDLFLLSCGIGGFIALALALVVGQRLIVRMHWRRSPAMRAPVQVHVVPGDGVTNSIAGVTSHFSWSIIKGFLETERVFVLQLTGPAKGLFVVLAKRGLASPGDIPGLRDLLIQETASAQSN